mgnify:CR=1 FL=1
MKKIIKNTLILLAITLVAGVALSYVYQLTKDPIAAAQAAAKEAAYKSVMTEATAFDAIDGIDEKITAFNEAKAAGKPAPTVAEALTAKNAAGEALGYVLTVSAKGYGGQVKIALGIDTAGTITGYAVLDCSGETAGFGARCKDADIAAQFPGKTSADELDGISGATYTTKALKAETQAAIDFVKELGGIA